MRKLFFILFFTITYAVEAKSETIFTQCNSCDSSYSFSQHAKSISSITFNTRNLLLVENPNTNIVEKYAVVTLRGEPGVPSHTIIQKQNLTNDEKQKINSMQGARKAIADFFDTYNLVPEEIANSAYDLVNWPAKQNQVSNHYLSNQSVQQLIGDYVSVLFAIAGKAVGVNMTIDVTFADGSVATFKIVGFDGSGSLALGILNARDINGNNISMVKAGFTSTMSFYFDTTAFDEFKAAAERLNIPVMLDASMTGTGGGGRHVPMSCSHVGGQYECEIIHN